MTISSIASTPVTTAPSDSARSYVQSSAPAPIAPKAAVAGEDASTQTPSPEHVAQAVKQVNEAFIQKGQNLYASLERDKATGINVVKFQDKTTKEVISQYPSKDIIAMAEALGQSQEKGRLINVSA